MTAHTVADDEKAELLVDEERVLIRRSLQAWVGLAVSCGFHSINPVPFSNGAIRHLLDRRIVGGALANLERNYRESTQGVKQKNDKNISTSIRRLKSMPPLRRDICMLASNKAKRNLVSVPAAEVRPIKEPASLSQERFRQTRYL